MILNALLKQGPSARQKIFVWVSIQIALVLLACLFYLDSTTQNFTAFLFGAGANVIPNIIMAICFFSKFSNSNRQTLNVFYLSEFVKLTLSVIILFIFLTKYSMPVTTLFFGFIFSHFALWIAPLISAILARIFFNKREAA